MVSILGWVDTVIAIIEWIRKYMYVGLLPYGFLLLELFMGAIYFGLLLIKRLLL